MHRPDPDEPRRRVVLLIEDEPHMRRFLRAALGAAGLRLVEAGTAREGLAEAAGRRPDVILLDLGLPDLDGIEVTRRIREWSTTPIIVISARGREQDKVAVFDAGADDYLTKPFGIDELLARIRVALRHQAMLPGQPVPVVEARGVRVDLGARSVTRDGNEVQLTPTEYRLLAVLVKHAGKILTHQQLLKEVWGTSAQAQSHYLRVHVNQLRHKLELDVDRPRLIQAELGIGYRLHANDSLLPLPAIASGMALALGVIGIYGVIAYTVSQRTREIGIRAALGASRRGLEGMVVRHGVALAGVGVIVGGAGAVALTRLMASLLFGISPHDSTIYVAVSLALVGIAALASYLPARGAPGWMPCRRCAGSEGC